MCTSAARLASWRWGVVSVGYWTEKDPSNPRLWKVEASGPLLLFRCSYISDGFEERLVRMGMSLGSSAALETLSR